MTHEDKYALIAQLRERIAELELRLGCCRDASTGKDLLIAELEAQVESAYKRGYDAGYTNGFQ